jgi:nucleoid-associated protein YejK
MKKSELRLIIKEIVKEEVALTIKEVIKEVVSPTKKTSKPKSKNYSKNSVLNDVLNETANGDWDTLGGGEYTTERMNDLVGGNYGTMMKDDSGGVTVDGNTPDFLKKDYRGLMKAMDKKKG